MSKEALLKKLEKYDFNCKELNNSLLIKPGLSQEVEVLFGDDGSVKIKDKLVGWNPLSGMIQMSVKSAMIYVSVSMIVLIGLLIVVYALSDAIPPTFSLVAIILSVWIANWTLYYSIKLESIRKTIIFLLESD